MMALLFIWVLFQAQRRNDFDASQFLRDDHNRLSWARLAAFICCMCHTWMVFTRTLNDKITFEEQVLYCLVWSGSLLLLQAMEVWRGVKTTPPTPPTEEKP